MKNVEVRNRIAELQGSAAKQITDVRDAARQHTRAAVETLVSVMEDLEAPHSARVAAANGLLDRGHGKATQIIEASVNVYDALNFGEKKSLLAILESFDDDACRIQLIAKVRYPDLSDPLVKMRASDGGLGSKFYFNSTAAYTAQTVGRGMRHEGDYCETIILDGSFGSLYDKNRSAFPLWFHKQLR